MKSLRKEGSYSVERRGSHLAGLEGQAFTIRITWAKFRWLEGEGSSKFGGEGGDLESSNHGQCRIIIYQVARFSVSRGRSPKLVEPRAA